MHNTVYCTYSTLPAACACTIPSGTSPAACNVFSICLLHVYCLHLHIRILSTGSWSTTCLSAICMRQPHSCLPHYLFNLQTACCLRVNWRNVSSGITVWIPTAHHYLYRLASVACRHYCLFMQAFFACWNYILSLKPGFLLPACTNIDSGFAFCCLHAQLSIQASLCCLQALLSLHASFLFLLELHIFTLGWLSAACIPKYRFRLHGFLLPACSIFSSGWLSIACMHCRLLRLHFFCLHVPLQSKWQPGCLQSPLDTVYLTSQTFQHDNTA